MRGLESGVATREGHPHKGHICAIGLDEVVLAGLNVTGVKAHHAVSYAYVLEESNAAGLERHVYKPDSEVGPVAA